MMLDFVANGKAFEARQVGSADDDAGSHVDVAGHANTDTLQVICNAVPAYLLDSRDNVDDDALGTIAVVCRRRDTI